MPLFAFWWDKYDVTIQEYSWLLSFLCLEKQDTFSGGSEKEANYRLPFLTNQKRASTNTRATSPSKPQWKALFRWQMPNALGKTANVVVNPKRKRLSNVSFSWAHKAENALGYQVANHFLRFLWKSLAKISLKCICIYWQIPGTGSG